MSPLSFAQTSSPLPLASIAICKLSAKVRKTDDPEAMTFACCQPLPWVYLEAYTPSCPIHASKASPLSFIASTGGAGKSLIVPKSIDVFGDQPPNGAYAAAYNSGGVPKLPPVNWKFHAASALPFPSTPSPPSPDAFVLGTQ